MSEYNQEPGPRERERDDDSVARESIGLNPRATNKFQSEVLNGWQVESMADKATSFINKVDQNKNNYITQDELDVAIFNAILPTEGAISNIDSNKPATTKFDETQLNSDELRLADKIKYEYNWIKNLSNDEWGFESEVSSNDLRKDLVPDKLTLEAYFSNQLEKLVKNGEMKDANFSDDRLDQSKYHFIDEALKAMARSDKSGLKNILDRYSLDDSQLKDYIRTINNIVGDKEDLISDVLEAIDESTANNADTQSQALIPLVTAGPQPIAQWHADALMRLADEDKNKYISQNELDAAIAKSENIEGYVPVIMTKVKHEYDSIKRLNNDEWGSESEVSDKDLETLVSNQPAVKQLENYLNVNLQRLVNSGMMNDGHGKLDEDQYHFTDEVFKAMAKGDINGLGHVLDRFGWKKDMLQSYTKVINHVLKGQGSSIKFDAGPADRPYMPFFTDIVFPAGNGKSRYEDGKHIMSPAYKERAVHYINGYEVPRYLW